jgi:hypothetical protein
MFRHAVIQYWVHEYTMGSTYVCVKCEFTLFIDYSSCKQNNTLRNNPEGYKLDQAVQFGLYSAESGWFVRTIYFVYNMEVFNENNLGINSRTGLWRHRKLVSGMNGLE